LRALVINTHRSIAHVWLIIGVGAAVLIGVLLAYGLIARRKRR
jgi:hypothetical protein